MTDKENEFNFTPNAVNRTQSVKMSAWKAFLFYQTEFECGFDLVLLSMNKKISN